MIDTLFSEIYIYITLEKKRISSVYNSDNLKDISTSEEVLSTMVKEPTERISKEMCLENWSIEGRQLGT